MLLEKCGSQKEQVTPFQITEYSKSPFAVQELHKVVFFVTLFLHPMTFYSSYVSIVDNH